MSFLFPKIDKPPKPPSTPTKADASVIDSGERVSRGYTSMISTSPTGVQKKARGPKRTLIGGTQ